MTGWAWRAMPPAMPAAAQAWVPIADGPTGILQIVRFLNSAKDHYGTLPAIRAAALKIAGTKVNDDQAGHVARLAAFVRNAVVYVADPMNAEFTQTPDVMLLAIHRKGQTFGDCDDHVLLFSSLVESLGVPSEIVAVKAPGSFTFNHVVSIAYPNGEPIEIDLCAKDGPAPDYPEKLFA